MFECSRAESLPPSVFPFPTESSNLFLRQEPCLTAVYRFWNEKPVTKASVPFTAIVSLKQGAGAKQSAKHGVAGFDGGPAVAAAAGLQWLVVACCCAFPPAGARARTGRWLLCHRSTSAALMKLDKWIRGAQIWAGIFEKRQRRRWREAGVGRGGWRDRKRQRHLCCWTTRGRVCCKNSLLLPKRQDSDKLSSPCSHLSPLPSPCYAHTHTHLHTHCHNAQFTTKMNGLPQCDTSWLQGEMVLVHQQKTAVLWGATACDRMLNCFRVNNLLSLHEPQFAYLPSRFQHSVLRWKQQNLFQPLKEL